MLWAVADPIRFRIMEEPADDVRYACDLRRAIGCAVRFPQSSHWVRSDDRPRGKGIGRSPALGGFSRLDRSLPLWIGLAVPALALGRLVP